MGDSYSFELEQTISGNFEPTYKDYEVILHGLVFNPLNCKVDGNPIKYIYDEEKGLLNFKISNDFKQLVIKHD
ncbi:MAG: hypothetical protein M3512_10260 [Bacteroidota bacterium]|nr:hypothetical protein [Bacteroidota bacterium]